MSRVGFSLKRVHRVTRHLGPNEQLGRGECLRGHPEIRIVEASADKVVQGSVRPYPASKSAGRSPFGGVRTDQPFSDCCCTDRGREAPTDRAKHPGLRLDGCLVEKHTDRPLLIELGQEVRPLFLVRSFGVAHGDLYGDECSRGILDGEEPNGRGSGADGPERALRGERRFTNEIDEFGMVDALRQHVRVHARDEEFEDSARAGPVMARR